MVGGKELVGLLVRCVEEVVGRLLDAPNTGLFGNVFELSRIRRYWDSNFSAKLGLPKKMDVSKCAAMEPLKMSIRSGLVGSPVRCSVVILILSRSPLKPRNKQTKRAQWRGEE